MKISKILESYLNQDAMDSKKLDDVSKEFKKLIINFINEQFVQKKINDENTRNQIVKNIDKLIVLEYNTLKIPYYHILENLNLCIEVESSDRLVNESRNESFGKYKFTEILENGFEKKETIDRFSIKESIFLKEIQNLVSEFTTDFKVDEDSLIIEFN